MNTAASEMVIETIVNQISRDPRIAASIGDSPRSMCLTIFSSITIASSTTKPTDRIIAIIVRLFSEYPSRYITAKVPTSETGNASVGISVALPLRRNRKITMITSASVMSKVT